MDYKKELITVLEQAGPERIRRPVYDNNNLLLADGIADERDGNLDDFDRVDFLEKTVLDLGCNFGFYSFLAKMKGADSVIGVDLDNLAIKGAMLLRGMNGIENVHFICTDFTSPAFSQRFDITMLIDFFGKENIIQGINKFLDTMERLTMKSMIISARNHYRVEKHFKGHLDTIVSLYSSEYIRNDRFYLIEYISHYFKKNWELKVLSGPGHDIGSKKTLYFQRK